MTTEETISLCSAWRTWTSSWFECTRSGCQLHLHGCWKASTACTIKTQTWNTACSFPSPALPITVEQARKRWSFRALWLSRKSMLWARCTTTEPQPARWERSNGTAPISRDLQSPAYRPKRWCQFPQQKEGWRVSGCNRVLLLLLATKNHKHPATFSQQASPPFPLSLNTKEEKTDLAQIHHLNRQSWMQKWQNGCYSACWAVHVSSLFP